MLSNKILVRSFVLLLVLVVGLVIVVSEFATGSQFATLAKINRPALLTVAFLDVGQGDSIYIETPDGIQMLIDGGPNGAVLRELSSQMSVLDRTIDVVLATHFDKDHIGGLVDVLKRYQVNSILKTDNKNDTTVTSVFENRINLENADLQIAEAGQQFQLGASTTILILSPTGDPTNWESNTASIVLQLQYGDIEFVLTGDAPINIEEYIAKSYGYLLNSEVLKLGHHGSNTSTADLFLDAIKPKYAVVSAGQDNSYGHPHQEVVDKLLSRNIKILNTAEEGTIVFKSDGKEVWVQ